MELDELRTQIREILAAPEFNYEPWWGQEWLEKLSDLLRRILPTGGAMELFGLPIETLLKWIGLLLLPFCLFSCFV